MANETERIKELEAKVLMYEEDGAAKLYYSLNRKANEIAGLMNRINISTLDLTDRDNKTFERMKVLWNDAASIATSLATLKACVVQKDVQSQDTTDEIKPVVKRITTPESIADSVGELAGKKS